MRVELRGKLLPAFMALAALLHGAGVEASARVVALAAPLGELVCEVGGCANLVGVSDAEAELQRQHALTTIGEAGALLAEDVLALEPTLVLAREGVTQRELTRALRRRGAHVQWFDVARLKDVAPAMKAIGEFIGLEADGIAAAEAFETRRAALEAAYGASDAEALRVFYQTSLPPLHTVDRRLPVSDAIALCGGLNVFPRLGMLEAPVSKQAVLLRKPEVIVVGMADGGEAVRAFWQEHPELPAVQHDGIIDGVDAALLQHASPRLLDGAERLCTEMEAIRRRIEG